MFSSFLLVLLLLTTKIFAGILPSNSNTEQKSRVLNLPLSEQKHFDDSNNQHNAEYDHEAFLGVEEAKKFEKLSPEESKKRLSSLIDRIDNDKNGRISKDELKNWIKSVQTRYITKDIDRQWTQLTNNSKSDLTWTDYDQSTFHQLYDSNSKNSPMTEQFLRLQKKDRRRFLKADKDGNGKLTKVEFADFVHPEQSPLMKELVLTETIEDLDRNSDGLISESEYLGDLWDPKDQTEKSEPDWMKTERENFRQYRDLDHDGQLNRQEVERWLMPKEYDNIQAETEHLFHQADVNHDDQLTKTEILDQSDLFVGSQATDWGEELRIHGEL